MEVKAIARRIRMSPKKVRLVADLVRGMDVSEAEAQLKFVKKAAARPVLKVIQSAKANAEHNHKIGPEGLFVKTIMVDGGPVFHRWSARAFGRAAPIRKRSSHITVVLDVRGMEGEAKGASAAVVKTTKETKKDAKPKKAEEKKDAKPKKAEEKKPDASKAKSKKESKSA